GVEQLLELLRLVLACGEHSSHDWLLWVWGGPDGRGESWLLLAGLLTLGPLVADRAHHPAVQSRLKRREARHVRGGGWHLRHGGPLRLDRGVVARRRGVGHLPASQAWGVARWQRQVAGGDQQTACAAAQVHLSEGLAGGVHL